MKKAQAAMEFLMTYGWAILVVLIAIGALAYFGVLNPGRFLPDKCTFTPGISCIDFVVTLDRNTNLNIFRFNLDNKLGETITVALGDAIITNVDTGVTNANFPQDEFIWQEGPLPFGAITLIQGNPDFVNVLNSLQLGQRYRLKIDIRYSGSSGLPHTITGEFTGRVKADPN